MSDSGVVAAAREVVRRGVYTFDTPGVAELIEGLLAELDGSNDAMEAAINAATRHYPAIDYVGVICNCGDRSDTRRDFLAHRDQMIRTAVSQLRRTGGPR